VYNQKLQLRMRLIGSATFESSMDAFDAVARVQVASEEYHRKGIGWHCIASCLAESPPSVQGVTYVIDGSKLFLAMNSREFEVKVACCSKRDALTDSNSHETLLVALQLYCGPKHSSCHAVWCTTCEEASVRKDDTSSLRIHSVGITSVARTLRTRLVVSKGYTD